jgi:hypothetical protein
MDPLIDYKKTEKGGYYYGTNNNCDGFYGSSRFLYGDCPECRGIS